MAVHRQAESLSYPATGRTMDFSDFNDALAALLQAARLTLRTELTSIWLPVQLGLIGLAVVMALAIASALRNRAGLMAATAKWPPFLRLILRAIAKHLAVIAFIIVLMAIRAALRTDVFEARTYLLRVAIGLTTAWVMINILASVIHNQFVNRIVAVSAWTIAALSILQLLEPVTSSLDSMAIVVGGLRITPLLVVKTTALLAVALWASNAVSNFLDRRLQHFADLTPSIQVLIGKLIRILLMTLTVIIVLSSMGIDLSVLALFSGAVGVGLGFGLQKIVSNLVSGIILLADKSVKPGDIISVGDHFGRVSNMGARYTSVDTRDGREYLIPNEDFITQRVANWTYSSDLVRLSVTFNSTYDSDPREAQSAAVDAALSVERVIKKPAPVCMLSAFGSTSIEYEMWFWIRDPAGGITNVKSDVLLALWDQLAGKGVKIPKPGPARVIYEMASSAPPAPPSPVREDEPGPPSDETDAGKSDAASEPKDRPRFLPRG
jgi:small-conductance mechanosensitive channel